MHRFAPLVWSLCAVVVFVAGYGVDSFRFCVAMASLTGIVSLLTDIRDRL